MRIWKLVYVEVFISILAIHCALARAGPPADEDAQRQAAVAEFTAKTKAANYPALFDQAASEFNVPSDLLKGIAFAETRWEHLTWPPGETESPENGMPRPFGIMSLWDNRFFGHSLLDAAQLIGKTPDELKTDPLQNIRGAAALLRKLYDETPKPDGTGEGDIESWRFALRKYCGVPEPDLNARHALDVYTFMSKGYHQYGIEWDARPVNLEPIRQETARIVAEEESKRAAQRTTNAALPAATAPELGASTKTEEELRTLQILPTSDTQSQNAPYSEPQPPVPSWRDNVWWFLGGALGALLGFMWLFRNTSRPGPG
jgi:hypothetical protein